MDRLLLVNHFHTDLEVNLLQPRGRRMTVVGCHVPAGGVVDVCARLGLPKLEARAIVEASPDYVNMFARSRMVELVDESSKASKLSEREAKRQAAFEKLRAMGVPPSGLLVGPPEGMSLQEYESTLDKMFPDESAPSAPAHAVGGDPSPEPERELVANTVIEKAIADSMERKGTTLEPPLDDFAPFAPVDDETEEPAAPTGALEPGVKEALSDTIPSTRWDKDRLFAHAKDKGLDVTEGMSKNALLRKIRGA